VSGEAAVVVGLGLDVVEVARIRRILEGPPAIARRFVDRCFTRAEQVICDGEKDRATRYAARFAAKEAASKALGVPKGITFLDVEVTRVDRAPALALAGAASRAAAGLGVTRTLVSLTHDGGVAVAVVVLEGR
jgi:holo-[acyl-carrier protein] synthase